MIPVIPLACSICKGWQGHGVFMDFQPGFLSSSLGCYLGKKNRNNLSDVAQQILERESRTSGAAKGPGLKSLHRSNPMSNKQRLTVPWPNHSGSSTQMATDENAKPRMPWETEPGTAKGPSPNIEHIPRRESLGCLQISDNGSAKCFETRLATHVV